MANYAMGFLYNRTLKHYIMRKYGGEKMTKSITFEKGDSAVLRADQIAETPCSLESRRCPSRVLKNNPVTVVMIETVECTCGSGNGSHTNGCAITENGHSQKLLLAGPLSTQLMYSAALFKKL